MGIILGLDIGSSTTKIAAVDEDKTIIKCERVSTSDQITSIYGAVGKLLYDIGMSLGDVKQVMITGMGASFFKGTIYDLPVEKVTEFDAIGTGSLTLSGFKEAIVCGLGTGTVLVYAGENGCRHVGGSAVGGGTLLGLSSRMMGIRDIQVIEEMAERGNLKNVDWGIAELSQEDMATLPDYATSSNLGKMKSTATDEDVLRGILNMIYQTAGTMAVFACRNEHLKDVIVAGSLATLKQAPLFLGQVGELYGIHFTILKEASFATAIGAAMLYFK